MFSSITGLFEELKDTIVPTVAKAEDDVEGDDSKSEDGEADDKDEGDDEDGDDDDEDDEDEDDEDEEEASDQLDTLKEECQNTPEGKELVHHLQECSERVKKASEQPGYEDLDHKEDCIEEFFHLQHYLDSCAAPRLFNKLK